MARLGSNIIVVEHDEAAKKEKVRFDIRGLSSNKNNAYDILQNVIQRFYPNEAVEVKEVGKTLFCLDFQDGTVITDTRYHMDYMSWRFFISLGDEEDEVEKVGRSRPIGRDQANTKMKAGSSATNAFHVESLGNMMAAEYVMDIDSYDLQKSQKVSNLLRIKEQELELKADKLEIRRLENCQRDEAFESMTDEDLKAILRQRLFG
uniref:Uncharacterized protein n=1 Tax=Tanacetum cinerariifolium TaxID=118510 RepID=A0A699HM21_TANCI|nr:hypothetical protein [Tanacetum cinerariifolium]